MSIHMSANQCVCVCVREWDVCVCEGGVGVCERWGYV